MTESVYWIWMQKLFGIGTSRAHYVAELFENPQRLFEGVMAGEIELEHGEKIRQPQKCFEYAKHIEEASRKKGIDIITPDHEDYPDLLQTIYAKPLALYVKGSLACLKDGLPIAMVGTRHPTKYGIWAANKIATELAKVGAVIVSGLANGIDSECHNAALQNGSFTIGVMGCGLDFDYPRGSSELKSRMKNNGAVISEYPLGMSPHAGTFPPRNRIIAGMCRGTVIVEAAQASGALITIQHALDAGRDTFAVPGSIASSEHAGIHRLLQDGGAKLITSARDILEEYPEYIKAMIAMGKAFELPQNSNDDSEAPDTVGEIAEAPVNKLAQRRDLPQGSGNDIKAIYMQIGENPKTTGVIAAQACVEISSAMAAMTELEIMGFVQAHPGGFFSIAN